MSSASSSDVGDGQGKPSDCILSSDLDFLWRSLENPLVVEDEVLALLDQPSGPTICRDDLDEDE